MLFAVPRKKGMLLPTAVVFHRNYKTILKIYVPDKGIKLSKLGQKNQNNLFPMKQTHITFVNSYYDRSFDLQNQKLMLWLMFIMIKSRKATLHRVNWLFTGCYTRQKDTLSPLNQLKS